jgi:DNA polymerase-3 subunit gamma/tau
MGELVNYSIETDQLIWLAFKDGRNYRVPVRQLPSHLAPHDLQKVRRAIKLRRDFFRYNMPRAVIIVMAASLLLALSAGAQVVAMLGRRNMMLPDSSSHSEIVRATPLASPGPVSPRYWPVNRTSPLVAAVKAPVNRISEVVQVPTAPKPAVVATTNAVIVTPIPSPALPVASPAPTPNPSPLPNPTTSPSPQPTPPADGQVLDDATTPPDPSPAP